MQHAVGHQQPRHPLCTRQGHGRNLNECLRDARAHAHWLDRWEIDLRCGVGSIAEEFIHVGSECTQASVIVEVTHGYFRCALANLRDQRGRGQRGATEGEEVHIGAQDRRAQRIGEQPGEPFLRRGFKLRLAMRGQWPRQSLLIHFAGGGDREGIQRAQARDHGCGEVIPQLSHGSGGIEFLRGAFLGGDVAHQDFVSTAGGLHHHGTTADVIQSAEGRVHLTEFDAPPTDLHLVIHTTHEVQTIFFEAYVITRAVGTIPAEFRHGSELLGVLLRI